MVQALERRSGGLSSWIVEVTGRTLAQERIAGPGRGGNLQTAWGSFTGALHSRSFWVLEAHSLLQRDPGVVSQHDVIQERYPDQTPRLQQTARERAVL